MIKINDQLIKNDENRLEAIQDIPEYGIKIGDIGAGVLDNVKIGLNSWIGRNVMIVNSGIGEGIFLDPEMPSQLLESSIHGKLFIPHQFRFSHCAINGKIYAGKTSLYLTGVVLVNGSLAISETLRDLSGKIMINSSHIEVDMLFFENKSKPDDFIDIRLDDAWLLDVGNQVEIRNKTFLKANQHILQGSGIIAGGDKIELVCGFRKENYNIGSAINSTSIYSQSKILPFEKNTFLGYIPILESDEVSHTDRAYPEVAYVVGQVTHLYGGMKSPDSHRLIMAYLTPDLSDDMVYMEVEIAKKDIVKYSANILYTWQVRSRRLVSSERILED